MSVTFLVNCHNWNSCCPVLDWICPITGDGWDSNPQPYRLPFFVGVGGWAKKSGEVRRWRRLQWLWASSGWPLVFTFFSREVTIGWPPSRMHGYYLLFCWFDARMVDGAMVSYRGDIACSVPALELHMLWITCTMPITRLRQKKVSDLSYE